MFYHPKTHARVVAHGDEFIFAATDSELRKMRSRMCEWYDVKVRGTLGNGKRDVREIEILGRSLRWREEWLEYEAVDKHRQALLVGIEQGIADGQQRSSQTRRTWARRGREHAGRSGVEEVQELGGDGELHEDWHIRCAIRPRRTYARR